MPILLREIILKIQWIIDLEAKLSFLRIFQSLKSVNAYCQKILKILALSPVDAKFSHDSVSPLNDSLL